MYIISSKINRIYENLVKGLPDPPHTSKGVVTHRLRAAVLNELQSKQTISLWNTI